MDAVNSRSNSPSQKATPVPEPEQVILRVLDEVLIQHGRAIHRTELVKLIYFVDYIYSQHAGRTLTGFSYIWDNYGPNATYNNIVKASDVLSWQGLVRIQERLTPSGNSKFLYEVGRPGNAVPLGDRLGELVIREVVEKYGNIGWREIVKASKRTRPFKKARPGDELDLSPSPQVDRVLRLVSTRVREGSYEDEGEGVSIEELKARYGLS